MMNLNTKNKHHARCICVACQRHPIAAAVMACLAACLAGSSLAQTSTEAATPGALVSVIVSSPQQARSDLPAANTVSINARDMAETTNVINTEDALKYLPGIMVRKRFIGDMQAPLATRTTGVNASARSLIFADGVLLSALVNNNNANGSPRWFMVAPEEIDSIDVMVGPFSAAYAGNSYGAVVQINTRMPTQFEATVKASLASQKFDVVRSSDRVNAQELNMTLGDRSSSLAWFFSANHLTSDSPPVTFGTLAQSNRAAAPNDPVIGNAYPDRNRTGNPIQVIGAGNLTRTVQDTAKIKVAYDFSSSVTAAYTLGFWQNSANANAQSYLTDAQGAPYFGAASGNVNLAGFAYGASAVAGQFASNTTQQEHWMQSLSVKSKTMAGWYGNWDWEAVASHYRYAQDLTRSSTGLVTNNSAAAQNGNVAGIGRIADASGTGWSTLDLKAIWRAQGSAHVVSIGAHGDQFKLVSPTWNSSNWISGDHGSLFSDSRGKTQTTALWLQDEWRLSPSLNATLGGRHEQWQAWNGYNFATASNGRSFPVIQPEVNSSGFSPKASLSWKVDELWCITGSFGKALRFPTVGELYQNVQTGATFTQANAFLKPENVTSTELAFERKNAGGKLRVSLFEEHVSDALIAQTSIIAGVANPVSFTQNIDQTRQRGIELVADKRDVVMRGLDLSGSVTWVDATILANSTYVTSVASTAGTAGTADNTTVGKRTPYVPNWRATAVASYRPDDRWTLTLATRYSGKQFATIDNTDTNAHTYQGFEGFLVLDARVHYQINRQWGMAAGVDNLNNRHYFLFHPFAQRTLFADLKFTY